MHKTKTDLHTSKQKTYMLNPHLALARENIGREWEHALLLVRNFSTVCKMRPPPLFVRVKVSVTFLTNKITVNTLLVAPKDDNSPSFVSNIPEMQQRFFFKYTSFERRIIFEIFLWKPDVPFLISIFQKHFKVLDCNSEAKTIKQTIIAVYLKIILLKLYSR